MRTTVFFVIFFYSSTLFAAGIPANTLPTGGQVSAGRAAIQQSGASMNVNQSSQNAIINWQQFNIGFQASVRFNQPNNESATLNRVLSSNPSQIFGSLSANGNLFLINPSGIIFGAGSRVDAGGFVASTLNMNDDDFMAARYRFMRNGATGSILNQGTLNSTDKGYIALLAPDVRNEGVIAARLGTVALAAGEKVTLNFSGDGLVNVAVDPAAIDTLIENRHLVQADGGRVIMSASVADKLYSSVINTSGEVRARGIESREGRIFLDSGAGGQTKVSGILDASSADGRGGGIVATGERVLVKSGAQLTASGATGGGEVLVGGSWQGTDSGTGSGAQSTGSGSGSSSASGTGTQNTGTSSGATGGAGTTTQSAGTTGGAGTTTQSTGTTGATTGGAGTTTQSTGTTGVTTGGAGKTTQSTGTTGATTGGAGTTTQSAGTTGATTGGAGTTTQSTGTAGGAGKTTQNAAGGSGSLGSTATGTQNTGTGGSAANAGSIPANTLPTGGSVVSGQAAITQNNASMQVNQSTQNAIINWQQFNIGSQAGVRFNQPSSTSATLNRVLTSNPSQIFGSLSANGSLFLINPSGIVFGAGSRVDAGSFVASTLNMNDNDFLASRYKFGGSVESNTATRTQSTGIGVSSTTATAGTGTANQNKGTSGGTTGNGSSTNVGTGTQNTGTSSGTTGSAGAGTQGTASGSGSSTNVGTGTQNTGIGVSSTTATAGTGTANQNKGTSGGTTGNGSSTNVGTGTQNTGTSSGTTGSAGTGTQGTASGSGSSTNVGTGAQNTGTSVSGTALNAGTVIRNAETSGATTGSAGAGTQSTATGSGSSTNVGTGTQNIGIGVSSTTAIAGTGTATPNTGISGGAAGSAGAGTQSTATGSGSSTNAGTETQGKGAIISGATGSLGAATQNSGTSGGATGTAVTTIQSGGTSGVIAGNTGTSAENTGSGSGSSGSTASVIQGTGTSGSGIAGSAGTVIQSAGTSGGAAGAAGIATQNNGTSGGAAGTAVATTQGSGTSSGSAGNTGAGPEGAGSGSGSSGSTGAGTPGTGSPGGILNLGVLSAAAGGHIVLVAPTVSNEGVIAAQQGTVVLAAGEKVTLNLSGKDPVNAAVDPASINTSIDNKGLIQADGGRVVVSASTSGLNRSTINSSGEIRAQGVGNRQGSIILDSGSGGQTTVSGKLDVSSADGKGGRIIATGERVLVKSGAQLTASGASGGGEVLVGGSWQGKDSAIRQATGTVVEKGALLEANATVKGDGGTVVAWSDVKNPLSVTRAYGTFEAKGGLKGGDGGRIETSGHRVDYVGISASAAAPAGRAGYWLIDPSDENIDQARANSIAATLNTGTGVRIEAYSGDVILNSNVSLVKTAGGDATLTFWSEGNVILQSGSSISSTSNRLHTVLWADSDNFIGGWIDLSGTAANPVSISTNGGGLWMGGGSGTASWTPHGGGAALTVGDGYATGSDSQSIGVLLRSSSINTNGGNVAIYGDSGPQIATGGDYSQEMNGIRFGCYPLGSHTGVTINSGAGSIYFKGISRGINMGANSNYAFGVEFDSAGGITHSVTSTATSSNAITIIGDASGAAANQQTRGVAFLNGSTTLSTGGGISITGAGGSHASNNEAIYSNSTLNITGTMNLDGGNGASKFDGVIAGSGGLTKAGSGTLTLSGANTYTGATTVSAGTLKSGAAGVIADGSAVSVSGGATWDLNNYSETVGSISGAGNISLGSASLTAGGDNSSTSVSGVISGTGGLTKAGSGTLTLSGANTYSGATTVSAGALSIAAASGIGSGNVVLGGGTLEATGDVNLASRTVTTTADSTMSAAATKTISGGIFNASGHNLTLAGGGNFTLTNTGNDFGSVTVTNGKNISLIDSNALTLNAVNSTGVIDIATLNGNLTLAGSITTTDASANAITLNAGKNAAAGDAAGGDIIVNGGSVSVGAGGSAALYTGSVSGSAGLTALIGSGSGRFRYNSDETTTNYTTPLDSGINAVYREQPTVTVTANSVSKTYNGLAYGGGAGVTYSGFVNGDDSAGLGGTLSYGGSSQGAVNAQNYSITPFGLNSGLGYTLAYANGQLTINPAALTVTANNAAKTYGQTVSFTGSEFTSSGLQNGETIGSVSLTSGGAAPTANVSGSPYAITPSAATGGSFNAGNYTITYVNGRLTVNPAALTVTANNGTKTYGNTLTFNGTEFTSSGLQNGETIGSVNLTSGGASATAGITGSPYAINPSNAAGGTFNAGNYTISYINGQLNVVPNPTTVANQTSFINALIGAGSNLPPALPPVINPPPQLLIEIVSEPVEPSIAQAPVSPPPETTPSDVPVTEPAGEAAATAAAEPPAAPETIAGTPPAAEPAADTPPSVIASGTTAGEDTTSEPAKPAPAEPSRAAETTTPSDGTAPATAPAVAAAPSAEPGAPAAEPAPAPRPAAAAMESFSPAALASGSIDAAALSGMSPEFQSVLSNALARGLSPAEAVQRASNAAAESAAAARTDSSPAALLASGSFATSSPVADSPEYQAALSSLLARGVPPAEAMHRAESATAESAAAARGDSSPAALLASGSFATSPSAASPAFQAALGSLLVRGVSPAEAMQRAESAAAENAAAVLADAKNPLAVLAAGNVAVLEKFPPSGDFSKALAAAMAQGIPMDMAMNRAMQAEALEQQAIRADATSPLAGLSSGKSSLPVGNSDFDQAFAGAIGRGASPAEAVAAARQTLARIPADVQTPSTALASGRNVEEILGAVGTSPTFERALGNALARGMTIDAAVVYAKRVESATALRLPLPPDLAKQVPSAAGSVTVTTVSGKPLPGWIRYDAGSRSFIVYDAPSGALPMEVAITVKGKRTVLRISENMGGR